MSTPDAYLGTLHALQHAIAPQMGFTTVMGDRRAHIRVPVLPCYEAKGPMMSLVISLVWMPMTRPVLLHDKGAVMEGDAWIQAHLEQDAGRGSDLNGGPAALKAPRGVVHKSRLLHVLQGAPWDPPQKRHQLAPVAHTQAESVRPTHK